MKAKSANSGFRTRLTERLRTPVAAFVHDFLMIPIAWFGAYWLRFNLDTIPHAFLEQAVFMAPIVMMIQGLTFWRFGLYRGLWRFASVPDLLRIFKAVVTGIVFSAVAIFVLTRLESVPRSVFVLHGFLLIFFVGGPRFLYRGIKDRHLYRHDAKKVLIVGAGQAGEMLARDLIRNPGAGYFPAAFVDDDKAKIGKDIHGIRVVASIGDIPQIVARERIDLILLAVAAAGPRQMRRIIEFCEQSGVPFRILPRLEDLVQGQVSVKALRDVKIEDLLGRESVRLDWDAISADVRGRAVLVTGGGGSIGSELCRQVARLAPSRLVIFELSEFNLYAIEMELREQFPAVEIVALLGSVCDRQAVAQAMRAYHPDMVLHAAAYKHVPMLEHQVRAAVTNNVFGTRVVASLADEYGVETFVLVSTDKAVNPSNVMGTTKRVAEIYCQSLNACSKTRYITVRFGNVLGSSGSVIPLFQKQIATGGPVTVTHPEITRFFMTIPEACQLILQASTIGKGGEIFVLDMGEPVKIAYLAEQLILLSGKKPGEDIDIVYTGLRPGEKLYEELFHPGEKLTGTTHPKIMQAISREQDREVLDAVLAALERHGAESDEQKMKDLLYQLVPEQSREGDRKGLHSAEAVLKYH